MAKKRSTVSVRSQAPLANQPWWVSAIVWVGTPTAALAFVLWWLFGTFTADLTALKQTAAQNEKSLTALVEHLRQETELSWAQLSAMQRTCLNTSKTESDKMECIKVFGKGTGQ